MVDTLDVLTTAEAQNAINAVGMSTYDTELETMVTAVSVRMDELCGPVVTRTVNETRDGGCCEIELYEAPIYGVSEVLEYRGTTVVSLTQDTPGSLAADGFVVRRRSIIRRTSGYPSTFWPDLQNIVITYDAGRYADTDSVGPRFKQAASIILAHVWRNERGTGNPVFGAESDFQTGPTPWSVPKRALDLLGDELRVPSIA